MKKMKKRMLRKLSKTNLSLHKKLYSLGLRLLKFYQTAYTYYGGESGLHGRTINGVSGDRILKYHETSFRSLEEVICGNVAFALAYDKTDVKQPYNEAVRMMKEKRVWSAFTSFARWMDELKANYKLDEHDLWKANLIDKQMKEAVEAT